MYDNYHNFGDPENEMMSLSEAWDLEQHPKDEEEK